MFYLPNGDRERAMKSHMPRANAAPERSAWKALNNLWLMTINLESGRTLGIEEVLPESSGGIYGWWGMNYSWSPNGDKTGLDKC